MNYSSIATLKNYLDVVGELAREHVVREVEVEGLIVPSSPVSNHRTAVRALEKADLPGSTARKAHSVMTDRLAHADHSDVTIAVNAITMGNIVRDAGFTNDELRRLLCNPRISSGYDSDCISCVFSASIPASIPPAMVCWILSANDRN